MKNLLSFLAVAFILSTCSKENSDVVPSAPTTLAPNVQFNVSDHLDKFLLDASATIDLTGAKLTYSWSVSDQQMSLSSGTSEQSYLKIPAGVPEESITITLKASDSKSSATVSQSVTIPSLTQTRQYGLGITETHSASNNVDYDWYLDQENTGPYTDVNCGPTSVTMAIKWMNPNFSGTPEDARNTYRSTGGWWFTNDVVNYLNDQNVFNYTVPLNSISTVKDQIDSGNIVILCLDMYYVEYLVGDGISEYHYDKPYVADTKGWGHFIVVKGYRTVDGNVYFEAYDPYSLGVTYKDMTPVGRDRYYKYGSLDDATRNWWNYAIVISKSSPPVNGRIGLHPSEVPVQSGR